MNRPDVKAGLESEVRRNVGENRMHDLIGYGTDSNTPTTSSRAIKQDQIAHVRHSPLLILVGVPLTLNVTSAVIHVIGQGDLSSQWHIHQVSQPVEMNDRTEAVRAWIGAVVTRFVRVA